MTETTLSERDAQRQFGALLEGVSVRSDTVIVERQGEPVAAIIPFNAYRQWQQQRDEARARFFTLVQESAERANLDPEEAEPLVAEAVAEVRAARRERTP
ncbi:MAG: type II toxin-antitoxin system Phd/YefM family antitoxin [Chloroflexota bacterium]|nr:type II toxin-antitoxin system Phd/YefM family antitoxin [Chloroflexota bacterium]